MFGTVANTKKSPMFKHSHNPNRSMEIVIPSDASLVLSVQERIEKSLVENKFSDKDVFSIKLALEEAIVNAIKHGNREDPLKKVTIKWHVSPELFEAQIRDEGPGFNPEEVPDPLENLEKESGRGLLLMRHYMSEVTYETPGNSVLLKKLRNENE